MSEIETQWLNMTTAFFVSEEYSKKKDNAKKFTEWLEKEGYSEVKHRNNNLYGAFYVDIASKTYARAHSDALLAPVVGYQGLKYDDFKEIHTIFKRRYEDEKTWRYRPANMIPVTLYIQYREISQKERDEDRRLYFEKNPSFEEWCDDVFFYIKHDHWYMRNMPDYSKEEFMSALEDKFILRDMENHFHNQEMPLYIASYWDIITF